MARRFLFAVLACSLAFIASQGPSATAALGVFTPDPDEFVGLPDLTPNSGHATMHPRFLVLVGEARRSVSGTEFAEGRTRLHLTFDPLPSDSIKIALYDGDTVGYWDQRPRATLLPTVPDVEYRLYFDPDQTGEPTGLTLASPAVHASDPMFAANDQEWVLTFERLPDAEALGADGLYHYLLECVLQPAADSDGWEACGFKVAANGRIILPSLSTIGFIGGAVDAFSQNENCLTFPASCDLGVGCDQAQGPPLQDRDEYDGTFEFPFSGCIFSGDLELFEADADWNKPIPSDDGDGIPENPNALGQNEVDEFPTGVPADSDPGVEQPTMRGGFFTFDDPVTPNCTDIRDNRLFAIAPQIVWELVTPANVVVRDSTNDAPSGHASISAELQYVGGQLRTQRNPDAFVANPGGPTPPYQRTIVPESDFTANPGTWTLRWRGVDMNNAVFMKFNAPFGTVPHDQTVSGDLWCDDDRDNQFDRLTEDPLVGVTVRLTPVDAAGTPIGAAVERVTDAAGHYRVGLTAGRYRVEVSGTAATPRITLPATITVVACDDLAFDIPFTCAQPGRIRVQFFKEAAGRDCDGVRQLDEPIVPEAGLRVFLHPVSPAGPDQQTLTDATGTAVFEDLPAGDYEVRADSTQFPRTVLTVRVGLMHAGPFDVTLPDGGDELVLVPLCPLARLHGLVFKERAGGDCNGVFDAGETPIEGVQVRLQPGGLIDVTDVLGQYSFEDLEAGDYTVEIVPGQAALASLTPSTDVSVGVTLLPGDDEQVDFGFCPPPGTITVRFFRERKGEDCDGIRQPDEPLVVQAGLRVTLHPVSPAGPDQVQLTNAAGTVVFTNLQAGTYEVRPDPTQFPATVRTTAELSIRVGLKPEHAGPYDVILPEGGDEEVLIPLCPLARLTGLVFKQRGGNDCDGTFGAGDTPIAGVTVVLSPAAGPDLTTTTNAAGEYAFEDLAEGDYTVSVDGSQPRLVHLSPSTDLSVDATLLPGDDVRVDFGFCSARISGTVFREANGRDCNGLREVDDLGIAGVEVRLSRISPPGFTPRTTTTNATGFYEFNELEDGTYLVEVPDGQAVLVGVANSTPSFVEVILLPGGDEVVDFGYCPLGAITGKIFKNPKGTTCDDTFDLGDVPIPGVEVALTPFDGSVPPAVAVTNAAGVYRFDGLPAGEYNVSVIDGQDELVGVTPAGETTVDTVVLPGETVEIDFGYCPLPDICGHVFEEQPTGDCDGVYEPNVDLPIVGARVWLKQGDAVLRETETDLDGGYCFIEVEAGEYEVVVVGLDAPPLADLEPSTPTERVVVLEDVDVGDVDFGFCRTCRDEPCCCGDLHELVAETEVCLRDGWTSLNVEATLWSNCYSSGVRIDQVRSTFAANFPGPVTGPNGVLTIQDVTVQGGVARVRVRLVADDPIFPEGRFGSDSRKLVVKVNECQNSGCVSLRCEKVRPGSRFTWSIGCGPLPPCDGSTPVVCNWSPCPVGCAGRFLVISTRSWVSWLRCEGLPPPTCDPCTGCPPPPCTCCPKKCATCP